MIEVGDDDNLAISTKIPSPLPNQISTKFRVRGIVRQMERFRRRVPFPLNCLSLNFSNFPREHENAKLQYWNWSSLRRGGGEVGHLRNIYLFQYSSLLVLRFQEFLISSYRKKKKKESGKTIVTSIRRNTLIHLPRKNTSLNVWERLSLAIE